jgi:hypothetical protein
MKAAPIDRKRLEEILSAPTVSVPVAGSLFGLGDDASYRAGQAGDLPTIRVGGRVRVPTAALRRMLGLDVT